MKDKIQKRAERITDFWLCNLTSESHGQFDSKLTSNNISYKSKLTFVRIVDDSKETGLLSETHEKNKETRHSFFNDAL